MITSIPSFTIRIGSPGQTRRLDEHGRVSVIHKISRRFDRFTLTESRGFFDGIFEDALLIHLATADVAQVAQLAEELRGTLSQEAVGIQCAGRYIRDTAETIETELTDVLRELCIKSGIPKIRRKKEEPK